MLLTVFILGLLGTWFLTALAFRKSDVLRVVAVGTGLYLAGYAVLSGMLIWWNAFSIKRGAACVLAVAVLIDIVLLLAWTGGVPKVSFKWKEYIPLAIILVIATLISCGNRAGLYNMTQDEGGYVVRAFSYMGGYNDNRIRFYEMNNVLNEWERDFYFERLGELTAYYNWEVTDDTSGQAIAEGVTHGINTFPAMMALWGKLFGIKEVTGILTVCYLLFLCCVWLICENYKFKPWVKITLTSIMMFCPIVLWCSQNSLSEMVLAMFIALFYALVTENARKRVTFISAIPIMGACFLHVQMAMLMPAVIVIYIINYLRTSHKGYLNALTMVMISFGFGFSMMHNVAYDYVEKNFGHLFYKTGYLFYMGNFKLVIWLIAITCIIMTIVLRILAAKGIIVKAIHAARHEERLGKFMKLLISLTVALLLVYFVYYGIAHVYNYELKINRMSFMGLLQMTGFVIFPLSLVAVIKKGDEWFTNRLYATSVAALLSVLVLYCIIVIPQIYYYYYYARYLAVFTFMAVIPAGYILNRLNAKIIAPVIALCTLVMIWQSRALYRDQDLTYCQYDMIQKAASCISSKDVVLVNEEGYQCHSVFLLPVKMLSGADVYFVDKDNLEIQKQIYDQLYDDVFLLTYDVGQFTDDKSWNLVYRDMMHSSMYETYYDYLGAYPLKADVFDSPVALYVKSK